MDLVHKIYLELRKKDPKLSRKNAREKARQQAREKVKEHFLDKVRREKEEQEAQQA